MNYNYEFKRNIAENRAKKLLDRYGINSPEYIRLRDIAFDMGIDVIEANLKNAVASIVKTKYNSTIRIQLTDSIGRKRFSIAHELGHFVLEHSNSIHRICSRKDMKHWSAKGEEAQANFFASELILPEKLVRIRCNPTKVTFDPILKIKEDFRTSLTASSIRFVKFCPKKCAVVFSRDNRIKWFYQSESWNGYIKKGQELDNRTIAYNFFNNDFFHSEPEDVNSKAWCESNNGHSVIEHSIGSIGYDFVLSLLWMQ